MRVWLFTIFTLVSGCIYAASTDSSFHESSDIKIDDSKSLGPLPLKFASKLQPELLSISINNSKTYTQPNLTLVNEYTLCIESVIFSELKINIKEATSYWYQDPQSQVEYACFVSNVESTAIIFNHLTGKVDLILPGKMLQVNNLPLASPEIEPNIAVYPTNAIYSNSLGYQLQVSQNNVNSVNTNQLLALFNNVTSTSIGSLVTNVSYASQSGFTRNSVYWETDFPVNFTSLNIGDITPSSGAWGGDWPLGGIQYGTNTALRPYANFVATPNIQGLLETPAQAEFFLDNHQIAPPLTLPAGPYSVYNLPAINGAGQLTVNLKNEQGTYQTVNLPYFTAPQVLQKGTYFYQYNTGYQASANNTGLTWGYQTNQPVFTTQQSYAFTNNYTMDLHSEFKSNSFYNFGLNHNVNLFNFLYSGLFTALSQSESGAGSAIGGTISRIANKPNMLGVSYTYSLGSPQFTTLSNTPNGNASQTQQSIVFNYITTSTLSLNVGYSTTSGSQYGAITAYNGMISYQPFVGASIILQAAQTLAGDQNTFSTSLNFSYALASGSINAGYNTNSSNNSSFSNYNLGYQYFDPTNTWGYNVNEQYADSGQTPNTISAGGSYAFKNFNTNTNVNYSNSSNYSSNGTIAGNIIIARNGINLARTTNASFAIVSIGLPNIGILLGDTYIGSTDRNGEFTIPNLPAYLPQQIKIRTSDLPLNVELDSYAKTVIAPLNGGVAVDFKVVHYTPATLSLRYNTDKLPPVGYAAKLVNRLTGKLLEDLIIIDDGVVMISKFDPNLEYLVEFTLQSGDYSCLVNKNNINQLLSSQYQYNLGAVQCVLKK